jgi:hypothetical protein
LSFQEENERRVVEKLEYVAATKEARFQKDYRDLLVSAA